MRRLLLSLAPLLSLAAACETVDVGPPLADVNACRPSQAFFVEQIWPNFLAKDFGGKRCTDSACHDAGSGRQLVLVAPTSAGTVPLPPDWAVLYKSVTEQLLCTNVASSPLLTRPDGRQTHGGGKMIDQDGAEATLVKMWVSSR
jgi:hypothetical protein